MAKLAKNHDRLYFDQLCRTQKGESVLSLIYATYQAKRNSNEEDVKNDIAKRLEYAYSLFKKDVGSYHGDMKQFESQYTIGHELAIWKNSKLDLTDLAIQVAENYITIRDYFDIVFLNYIQPVNNRIIHILYHLLEYMRDSGKTKVTKDELGEVYRKIANAEDKGNVNGAYNMLIASNYFKADSTNKELVYIGKYQVSELMGRCNTTYIDKGYEAALIELDSEENYINYLLKDYRIIDNSITNELPEFAAVEGGENRLFYGVPGAGKSFAIKQYVDDAHGCVERVVFHPDYTYSDFVGQIMPYLSETNKMEYRFVPGPFTSILKHAKKDPKNMHYLIIEELNRGNAPAIFGEIFQLLDRDEHGESEYGITNFDIAREVYGNEKIKVKLPSNITILATMNTADQNVFTLDTAFQRRWNMKMIENRVEKAEHHDKKIQGTQVSWEAFALSINQLVVESNADMIGSEDKRLGAYFVKERELQSDFFPEKVLKYLWDDAFKMDKEKLFNSDLKSFDELISNYEYATEDKLKAVLRLEVYSSMLDKMKSTSYISSESEKESNQNG